MYFLYILKSQNRDWHYIGTTENLENRIAEHNAGEVRSTKACRPLKVVYKEVFLDKTSVRKREIFLKKTAKARSELLTKIDHGLVV